MKKHLVGEYVKCFECVTCPDCNGRSCIDSKRRQELDELENHRKNARRSVWDVPIIQRRNLDGVVSNYDDEVLVLPPMVPDCAMCFSQPYSIPPCNIDISKFHPHISTILGVEITDEIREILTKSKEDSHISKRELRKLEEKKPVPCPRCEGLGFTHTDKSLTHNQKKAEKCKNCQTCKGKKIIFIKGCSGAGKVVQKGACINCNMRGFVHTSTERSHDVSEFLRCFFCKDCGNCGGTGLEDLRKKKKQI